MTMRYRRVPTSPETSEADEPERRPRISKRFLIGLGVAVLGLFWILPSLSRRASESDSRIAQILGEDDYGQVETHPPSPDVQRQKPRTKSPTTRRRKTRSPSKEPFITASLPEDNESEDGNSYGAISNENENVDDEADDNITSRADDRGEDDGRNDDGGEDDEDADNDEKNDVQSSDGDKRKQPKGFTAAEDDDDADDTQIGARQGPIRLRTRPICPRTVQRVVLFFPHVNKAGGRTVEGTFEPSNDVRKPFKGLPREARSKKFQIALIDGHRDYNELRALAETTDVRGACVRWIFFLRDPVARTISAFNTIVGRKTNPITRMSDHFYCESPKIKELMRNESFTFEDFAALPFSEIQTCQRDYHVLYMAGKNGGLDLAKRRLRRMDFVGIAEDFTISMQLMSWELDLDLELYTPIFNKNPYEKTLQMSERAQKVAEWLNQQDIALYKFAKEEIYDQRVLAMKAFYGGKFPWGDQAAACDKEVICWDKRFRRGSNLTWPFDDDPPERAGFKNAGEMKENILCAPKTGCRLVRPEAQPIVTSNATLPPPLKVVSQSKCIASVFIVGARKGGSTSLYQYFSKHPNFRGILLDRGAQSGETFFFETRSLPSGDERALHPDRLRELYDTIYTQSFKQQGLPEALDPKYFLTGESSVGMGPSCFSPRVLKETCGQNVKIIYLLRDPVARMLSQYQMRARLKRVQVEANFTADSHKQMRTLLNHPMWPELQTWLASPNILASPPPCLYANDFLNSLWSGLYIVHLARWFRQMKPQNVLIVQSEEFFRNPKQAVENSMKFVGLDVNLVDSEAITSTVFNAAPSTSKKEKSDDAKMLQELREFFKPYNRVLTDFLSEQGVAFDLTLWKSSRD